MKKILIVFGTRPEAIKMAPVIKEFKQHTDCFELKVCVTAQHRELLDQVLELFNINPDYDLNIMQQEQNLFNITSDILIKIRDVLDSFKPDIVLVHGDTTTTFATALSAFYHKIKIGHIEAGLRTNNIYSPWPEEANRHLTSVLTNYHFAPTENAKQNLLKENITEKNVLLTGNTIIDSLFLILKKINNSTELKEKIILNMANKGLKLQDNDKIILVTGHRRENFGKGIINICQALKELAMQNENIKIVYPVHLNPNVRNPVKELLSNITNIFLIEPLDYEDFVYLMSISYLILTDSGGIQEEAPSLGKPVLVMRNTTERPEAVEAGVVKLVGTDKEKIIKETSILLTSQYDYDKMSKSVNPYGDGKASERIVNFLKGVQVEK